MCIFHKWVQYSPKFPDNHKYYAMSFSVYSCSSNYHQFEERCNKCGKTRVRLEETIISSCKWYGRKNRITIPNFTVKEGLEYKVSQGIRSIESEKP